MSEPRLRQPSPPTERIRTERSFARFARGQRWEHGLLILTFTVLLLTGLPQKYRDTAWSHYILATPERLELVQTIHRVAAVVLTLEAVYHMGRAIALLARRRLPADIFLQAKDLRDAGQMLRYLLFLTDRKPRVGKYSFEQKYTYWFVAFGLAIMIVTGFILWFPILFTRIFPGGIIPAAKLAHSSEAIVGAIFVVIWHLYHVLVERLNLSIFTGRLNEDDMREHHPLEYERLTGEPAGETKQRETA